MSNTIPPLPNPTVQQLHDARRRKRKPLIDLNHSTAVVALKKAEETIENLLRQLRDLQAATTAKEAYIQELENNLAKALSPEPQPAPATEPDGSPQGRRARRPRIDPEAEEAKSSTEDKTATPDNQPPTKPPHET